MKRIEKSMKNNYLINLDETLFIGEGNSRQCYEHPGEKHLCIKVASDSKRVQRSIRREVGYFKRLKKRAKSFAMISRYFHPAQTNKGEGEIYELIRDHDGLISKNIRYYLDLQNEKLKKDIQEGIETLRMYLIDEYILFSDLGIDNILLQKISLTEYRLVVIDGIGDNNQVPFLEYVPMLGMRRSARKWEIFRKQLIEEYSYSENDIKTWIIP